MFVRYPPARIRSEGTSQRRRSGGAEVVVVNPDGAVSGPPTASCGSCQRDLLAVEAWM